MNKNKDYSFWANKKILITGHTGFKGSWLSLILKNLNSEVYGLSDEKKEGMYKILEGQNIFKKEIFKNIDTLNKEDVEELMNVDLDCIFHLAAQSLVIEANKHPRETLITNIVGTFNVLEFFNNHSTARTMCISTTDKVYKNTDSKNKEDAEIGGAEFYSASKASAENIIEAFNNEILKENKNIVVVRSGNVIGGGDRGKHRLIPDIVNSIKENKKIILRNPESIRPWQSILDSLSGYLISAEYSYINKKGEKFNLNSEANNKYNVLEVTEMLVKIWESNSEIEINNDEIVKETDHLFINSEKAKKVLDWSANTNIEESLNKIVIWEKSSNKYQESLKQVKDFFNS